MNEKFKTILAGFPGKRNHSQLMPYSKLILELHRRGCSFRKIAPILSKNFGLNVASTTISRFVLRLEQKASKPKKTSSRKEKPVPGTSLTPKRNTPPVESSDEIRQRIAALKQRTLPTEPEIKRFEYNPDQPLHIMSDDEKACYKAPVKPDARR